ncbi:hypothetical protein RO3G_13076 [Rhizopus delemar RA 99-880]|uniref:Uncharacterized protein n=1 Tax=Rhizopus delemar (strain RA 99-880 / ATCC MYA-4621 / FGSC 9543 / NRRL 43880) TaxID=246409 RepID=I1CIT5_RHIO9|nr:hypothetical protein RO3G_13076 [Rhizopus delemar RA 99-880]|eukprot:EIE88365.1 hypothetical protein RO3G_13076 [Rhizopus delemar RA 99-880]
MNPKRALSVILVTGMDIDYLNVHVKIASNSDCTDEEMEEIPRNFYNWSRISKYQPLVWLPTYSSISMKDLQHDSSNT